MLSALFAENNNIKSLCNCMLLQLMLLGSSFYLSTATPDL